MLGLGLVRRGLGVCVVAPLGSSGLLLAAWGWRRVVAPNGVALGFGFELKWASVSILAQAISWPS